MKLFTFYKNKIVSNSKYLLTNIEKSLLDLKEEILYIISDAKCRFRKHRYSENLHYNKTLYDNVEKYTVYKICENCKHHEPEDYVCSNWSNSDERIKLIKKKHTLIED